MHPFSAACIQTPPGGVATPEYVDVVLRGAPGQIDLAVLPELCTVPYFPLEPGSLDAESPVALDGPEVAAFGQVAHAHACHLMLGLHLADADGAYNAAVLLGPSGAVLEGRTQTGAAASVFRKVHLCDVQLPGASFCESAYFTPGDDYVVWDTPLGTIAALICYDRHFPEAWVAVREMGAEIVCVCTTSPLSTEASFVAEIQGMALQQSVYAAVANRVGAEALRTSGRRTEFLGSSCLIGPLGDVLAVAPARAPVPLVRAELTPEPLEHIRVAHQFHEHRRPDTYLTASG
jgi:predicted amidohydrolase